MSGTKSVLIVMNDPADAWLLGREMLRHGFSTCATTSGIDGFHRLETTQYDFLVVDESIEETGVLTFLSYGLRYFPAMRIIVLLDDSQTMMPDALLLAGAHHCIARPLTPSSLLDIISRTEEGSNSAETVH
jgi:DNA-binding NtrC family response regulator